LKYLNNFILVIAIFLLGCNKHDIKYAYSAETARIEYSNQAKKILSISNINNYSDTLIKLWGNLNFLYTNNINFIQKPSFFIADSIKNMNLANILKPVTSLTVDNLNHDKLSLHIGNLFIQPVQFTYPHIRQEYYMYNTYYNTYYAWYPQEWAIYVLQNDENSYKKFNVKKCQPNFTKTKTILYSRDIIHYMGTTEYWDSSYHASFNIVSHTAAIPYTIYSLQQSFHFEMLAKITAELDNYLQIDSLIIFLQNQGNYITHSFSDNHCITFIDTIVYQKQGDKFLYRLKDTCKLRTTPYIFLDIYEKISIAGLSELELIYPDFTKEKIPEIAEYAEKTKPTFIYFKRAYRSGYSNEPYNYFIFYYIDFIPFMPPRLRDMQVVFPRRVGLS
jgi:hypothetical protein